MTECWWSGALLGQQTRLQHHWTASHRHALTCLVRMQQCLNSHVYSSSPALLVQALSAAAALEGPLAQVLTGAQQPSVYLPDPAAISGAGARQWGFLPGEAQSLLLQRLQELPSSGGDGGTADSDSMGLTKGRTVLLLWSDMPRALSQRERLWATAVAAKLSSILAAG